MDAKLTSWCHVLFFGFQVFHDLIQDEIQGFVSILMISIPKSLVLCFDLLNKRSGGYFALVVRVLSYVYEQ
jgi:hypothetical protein